MLNPSQNLITALDPESPASEAYRTLRTNLTLRDFDSTLRVINVISTSAQESKSTTILNLAYVHTQLGKRVLVVDLDLRLPSLHKKLNLRNKLGVADVIGGQCKFSEAVVHYADKFDVLLSGTKIPFASEFIQSEALKQFIKQSKEVYDLVLLDCPPVGLVTDGVIASGLCDGTILCVASGHNERRELERTKDLLTQMNVKILGIVMTRMPMTKKYYNYSYRYAETTKKKKGLFGKK